jgi:serine/threonine protein kinase
LCPSPPEAGMSMIVKSTWVRPSHVKQELKVLVHLHKPSEGGAEHGSHACNDKSDIPYPVGMVRNTFINDTEQSRWTTTQKDRQNSTMATFCGPAQLVPDVVKARDRFWLLEGFFHKMRLMTERGVLYRDVNEGNIMQNKRDGSRAVIIDFGNARIGNLEDGQEATGSEPAGVDAKIARSVNKVFSSRRIHRLVDLEGTRSKEEKTVQMNERKSRRTTDPGAKRMVEKALEMSKKDLKMTTSLIRRDYDDCCHLDDCESGMLWYLYSVGHNR